MINNLLYILIFSPLMLALLFQILPRSDIFLKPATALSFLFFIIIISLLLMEVNEVGVISSDLSFTNSSIGLEFSISLISLIFLTILLFLKLNQIFQIDARSIFLDSKKCYQSYLSLQFVNIFAIVGVIVSTGLFNTLIFLEIFIISAISTATLYNDDKIKEFFCRFLKINMALTMIMIAMFVLFVFADGQFKIYNLSSTVIFQSRTILSQLIIAAILIIYGIKLLAFWLFNIKNTKNFSALLSQLYSVMFINVNMSLYLLLKFYSIITSFNSISVLFGSVSIFMVCLCSMRLLFAKQTRLQISLICASVFLLAVGSLLIKNQQSILSFLLYLFILNSLVLIIFNIFYYASVHCKVTNINDFSNIRVNQGLFLRCISYFFIFCMAIIMPLPYSPTFFANYFFVSAILENNDLQLYEYTNLLDPYFLFAVISFQFVMLYFCYRYTLQMFAVKKQGAVDNKDTFKIDGWFIIINISVAVVIATFYLDASMFKFISKKTFLIFLS